MIDQIYSLGDDALQNLWEMTIGNIPFIGDPITSVLRIQNVSIPSTGVGTYDIHYKTQKFTKPNGKIESPNEFSFTFRVDRNWIIYKAFVLWKNAIANTHSGTLAPDNPISNLRVPISVWAIDGTGLPIPAFGRWTFNGCFVSSIGEVGFDYSGGEVITTDVTMQFLTLDDNFL